MDAELNPEGVKAVSLETRLSAEARSAKEGSHPGYAISKNRADRTSAQLSQDAMTGNAIE
jgi:hypothetical protein